MTNYQDQIDTILDEFDFNKVHKVMTFLRWQWASTDGVPTVGDLRRAARVLLREVSQKERLYSSTGGFKVTKEPDLIKLEFVLEEWEEEI